MPKRAFTHSIKIITISCNIDISNNIKVTDKFLVQLIPRVYTCWHKIEWRPNGAYISILINMIDISILNFKFEVYFINMASYSTWCPGYLFSNPQVPDFGTLKYLFQVLIKSRTKSFYFLKKLLPSPPFCFFRGFIYLTQTINSKWPKQYQFMFLNTINLK